MRWGKDFPYGNQNSYHECCICGSPYGWGPMLRTSLWELIKPRDSKIPVRNQLMCQPCMERRLGRKLKKGDLRDCPMNEHHRLYVANGAV